MNVLITADIHLGIYSDFNYKNNSRLDQFEKLADRLIELGKENNCEECWILGDFLRVPNCGSRVEHRLKLFIKSLCLNFKEVKYILGQHDLNAKSNNYDIYDTIVSVPDFSNFVYMDKRIFLPKDSNHIFAFMNWRPDQDLSWLPYDKVDVLLGHYTKSSLFGQDIDETRFDLMIHGDIHNDQVLGKFVSVGNPIQHDFSSQSEGTCVLLNTDTLEWKHIKVDPDHSRFLRLYYTDNPNLEGFTDELSYYFYKPKLVKSVEVTEVDFGWDDINDLIDQVVKSKNLESVHNEIITNGFDSVSIDFNIKLISLDIKGYRSVTDFHIDFKDRDRIVLLGSNGSGKSSILHALKAVFEQNKYAQYEKSDLCDEQLIQLKFIYQNQLVEITKGDQIKLVVDGETKEFNSQRDFNNNLIDQFPFINYLDIFFINAGSSNLSNQLDSERRIELISRFYRLDNLQTWSDLAFNRYQEELEKINGIRDDYNKLVGVIEHITNRLNELTEIDIDKKSELEDKLQGYLDLRIKYDNYHDWKLKYDSICSRKSEVESSLSRNKAKLVINPEEVNARLEEVRTQSIKLRELLKSSTERANRFKELNKLLDKLAKEGAEINKKLDQLRSSTCPECGASLSESKQNELVTKYEDQLVNMRTNWTSISEQLAEYTKEEKSNRYFITLLNNIENRIKDNKDEEMLLSNKVNSYSIAVSEVDNLTERLQSITKELSELESNKPEEIKLPLNLNDLEIEVRSELTKISDKERELKSKDENQAKLDELESNINSITEVAERYLNYSKLMGTSGEVIEQLLKLLCTKFSTNEIKYEVNSGVFRGKRFVELNTYFKVRKKWRLYETCSDGQKQLCDLDFLNKLFSSNIGFLVLDEYFRHLDDINYPKCMELLNEMNVNTILISTHDPNITTYTKRVLLQLDELGRTIYSIQ